MSVLAGKKNASLPGQLGVCPEFMCKGAARRPLDSESGVDQD